MYGLGGAEKGKSLKKPWAFKAFLKGQSGHEYSREELRASEPSHFWVTLEPLSGYFGSLPVTLGRLMITLGSLWSHFGCMRVDFQKTFIFPIDFNDFIKHWGSFGVALGSLWGHF